MGLAQAFVILELLQDLLHLLDVLASIMHEISMVFGSLRANYDGSVHRVSSKAFSHGHLALGLACQDEFSSWRY